MVHAPLRLIVALAIGALPAPPQSVTLRTRMFGVVEVPHARHLALRVPCRDCHGDGRAGKIEFTPQVAHERCIGCHRAEARGPTGCRECHAVADDAPGAQAAAPAQPAGPPPAPEPAGGEGAVPSPAPTPRPLAPAARTAARDPEPPAPASGRPVAAVSVRRSADVGVSSLYDGRGASIGPIVNLRARGRDFVVMHSVQWTGPSDGHTTAVIGAGLERRVAPGWRAAAIGVGGIDASHRAARLVPALGLRLELDWKPGHPHLDRLGASILVGGRLGEATDPAGERISRLLVALGLSLELGTRATE